MKKLLTLSAVALLGMAVFTGCSKSSSSSPSYSMKATVGSSAYSVSNCIATSTSGITVIEGLGSSTSVTFPYMSIWISSTLKTGTFTFDSTLATNYAQYLTSATTVETSKTGSVTITSVSPSVVGTYSFTCTDGTAVTSGSFTAKNQ